MMSTTACQMFRKKVSAFKKIHFIKVFVFSMLIRIKFSPPVKCEIHICQHKIMTNEAQENQCVRIQTTRPFYQRLCIRRSVKKNVKIHFQIYLLIMVE